MKLDYVFGVLVLYKCSLYQSETFVSLKRILEEMDMHLSLLVYDNSPQSDIEEGKITEGNIDIIYKHNPSNPGICNAYNKGLEIAEQLGKKWLLLLDQDTALNKPFFEALIQSFNFAENAAAIVPYMRSHSNIISPAKYDWLGRSRPLVYQDTKKNEHGIFAINSCACISVAFLANINGFTPLFPLDMLDHWLFSIINKRKNSIFVLPIKVEHALSVDDYDTLSILRYEKIVEAELRFSRTLNFGVLKFKLRLCLRLLKLFLNKRYSHARISFMFLFR